jgi:hypothetical protein
MAANKEYSRRQDAVRAAKKEFGDNWEEQIEIFERETPEGKKFVYDFRRSTAQDIESVAESITSTLTQAIPAIVDAVIHPVAKESTPSPAPDEAPAPESSDNSASHGATGEGVTGTDDHMEAETPEQRAANEKFMQEVAAEAAQKYPGDPSGWLKVMRERGDAAANAQTVEEPNPLTFTKCPHCESEELYVGRVEQKGPNRGKVVDEDHIIGCHHCDWEYDDRKAPTKTNRLQPRISTAEKPTKLVWEIADRMTAENADVKRKDVIDACVAAGIAFGTARTQYQHWFKQKNVSAAEPRAKIENGKVVPPSK